MTARSGLEAKVDALTVSVGVINERLERYDLNGHYKDLQALAEAAPLLLASLQRQQEFATLTAYAQKHVDVMVQFLQVAPDLIKMVNREKEVHTFREGLWARTRWLRWLGGFIRPAIVFVLGYLLWTVLVNQFHISLKHP